MKSILVGAAAVLFIGAASAQQTKPPAPHTVDLKKYVDEAAAADLFEVKASQLALQRSQDPAIRQFAQHMVSEHTDSTNKLKMELGKAKVDIDPPKELDAERQALLDTLMNTATDDFNKSYMTMQIAGHEEALKLHSEFAKTGNDEFRRFAGNMTTHVKQHLDQAKRIGAALPKENN